MFLSGIFGRRSQGSTSSKGKRPEGQMEPIPEIVVTPSSQRSSMREVNSALLQPHAKRKRSVLHKRKPKGNQSHTETKPGVFRSDNQSSTSSEKVRPLDLEHNSNGNEYRSSSTTRRSLSKYGPTGHYHPSRKVNPNSRGHRSSDSNHSSYSEHRRKPSASGYHHRSSRVSYADGPGRDSSFDRRYQSTEAPPIIPGLCKFFYYRGEGGAFHRCPIEDVEVEDGLDGKPIYTIIDDSRVDRLVPQRSTEREPDDTPIYRLDVPEDYHYSVSHWTSTGERTGRWTNRNGDPTFTHEIITKSKESKPDMPIYHLNLPRNYGYKVSRWVEAH